jgi:hypothetical protein
MGIFLSEEPEIFTRLQKEITRFWESAPYPRHGRYDTGHPEVQLISGSQKLMGNSMMGIIARMAGEWCESLAHRRLSVRERLCDLLAQYCASWAIPDARNEADECLHRVFLKLTAQFMAPSQTKEDFGDMFRTHYGFEGSVEDATKGFFAPPREPYHSTTGWDSEESDEFSDDGSNHHPQEAETRGEHSPAAFPDGPSLVPEDDVADNIQLLGDLETLLMMKRIPNLGNDVGEIALQSYLIKDKSDDKQVTLHHHRVVSQMSFIYHIVYIMCVIAPIQEMEMMRGILATWRWDDKLIDKWKQNFVKISKNDKKFKEIFNTFMTTESKGEMYKFLNTYASQLIENVFNFRIDFLSKFLPSDWDIHRLAYSMIREAWLIAAQRDKWDRYRRAAPYRAFSTSLFNPSIISMGLHLPGRMDMREQQLPMVLLPPALQLVPATILPQAEFNMQDLSYLSLIRADVKFPSMDTKLRKWRWREQDRDWNYVQETAWGWSNALPKPVDATGQITMYDLLESVTKSIVVALHWTRFSFPRTALAWQRILPEIIEILTTMNQGTGSQYEEGPWNVVIEFLTHLEGCYRLWELDQLDIRHFQA